MYIFAILLCACICKIMLKNKNITTSIETLFMFVDFLIDYYMYALDLY